MMKPSGLSPVLFLLAAIACGPPQRTDPYTMLSSPANASYQNLKAGMVLSDNSKKAYDYLKQATYARHDPNQIFLKAESALRNYFGEMTRYPSIAHAAKAGVDVVAILDVYANLGLLSLQKNTIDIAVILTTPYKRPIAEARGQGTSRVPIPNMAGPAGAKVLKAADAAVSAMAMQLKDSKKLAAFALAKKTRDPASAVPTPGKVPGSYSSAVDTPGYKMEESPNDFAMVVGIEKYANLPGAEFAKRDAAAVRRHLIALGYPERNIIYLTGQNAVRSGIKKYLESWLKRNVTKDSRVFFYFSGHGAPDPRSGEAYLVPWDGDAKFLEDTGYPLKRLYKKLARLKAKEVVVALDACFSGAGGRSVLAKGTRPLVTKVDTNFDPGKRVVALTASDGDEVTGTLENEGHGIFTYYLLKGLSGAATDAAGHVTVSSLYNYLKPEVQTAARRDNREQTPQILPGTASGGRNYRLR